MATMIPREFPEKTFTEHEIKEENGYKFERKMYEFFKCSDLDDDVRVRYDLPFLNSDIDSNEGQTDFLIISKKFGLIIVEAKGGEAEYKYENGFFKRGRISFKPEQQAKKQVEKLLNYIKNTNEKVECDKRVNIKVSSVKYCIAFEKFIGKHFDGTIGEFGRECVIYFDEFTSNNKSLSKYFWELNKFNNSDKISDEDIEKILDFINPNFQSVDNEIDIIDEHNNKAKYEFQSHYSKLINELSEEYSNALIVGPAGCGKTYIAKELVKRKRNEGLNVAYFAYNIFFTKNVENELGKGNDDFQNICRPLKEFYKEYALYTGVLSKSKLQEYLDDDSDDFYTKYIYDYIFAALEQKPLQYDVIVLDEAEDIANADNLLVLSSMLKGGLEKGNIYIFADFNQKIFDNSSISKDEFYMYLKSMNKKFGKPIELDINFRNPYRVTLEVNKLLNLKIKSNNSEEYGDYDARQYRNQTSRINKLDEILEYYINSTDFKNCLNRITILSNYNCKDSEILENSPLKDSKFKDYFVSYDKREENKISVTKLRKFKGLSNDIIIMVDLNNYIAYNRKEPNTEPNRDLLYIGITSANYKVYLLETDDEKRIHYTFK